MKNRTFFIIFIVTCLLFFTKPVETRDQVRATWLWTPETIVQHPEDVLSLCRRTNINTLYVRVGYDYTVSDTDAFKKFNKRARALGIHVIATEGNPSWGLIPDHPDATFFIKNILDFNDEADEMEQFYGVQLDIEPYDTPQFHENKRYYTGVWIQNIQNLYQLVKENDNQLQVGGAFPAWLNHYEYAPTPSEYDGRSADRVFMDLLDFYVIMAYRDTVSGNGKPELPGSIDSISRETLRYAQNHKCIIAIETIKVLHDGTPLHEALTFYQEGPTAVHQAVSSIEDRYAGQSGFGGVAIHEYNQWKAFHTQ